MDERSPDAIQAECEAESEQNLSDCSRARHTNSVVALAMKTKQLKYGAREVSRFTLLSGFLLLVILYILLVPKPSMNSIPRGATSLWVKFE